MLKEILNDFNLSEDKISQLNKLREICLEYNKHTNLTSITDEDEFNIKHILDSLSILKFHKLNGKRILDVGSGGGFPGLALAIVLDDAEVVMLDSNNKKTKYIDFAIKELGLTNASTITARVEETEITEKFDIVLSRAVAALNVLLEITAHTARVNGELIYYKGSNLDEELPNEWNIIEEELGISFKEDNSFMIDNTTERRILSFTKVKSTKKTYPRMYSTIKKTPLY